jgi:hypothetical protein
MSPWSKVYLPRVSVGHPAGSARMRRRAGTEARIGILKNVHIGRPLRSKGYDYRERRVAWAIFSSQPVEARIDGPGEPTEPGRRHSTARLNRMGTTSIHHLAAPPLGRGVRGGSCFTTFTLGNRMLFMKPSPVSRGSLRSALLRKPLQRQIAGVHSWLNVVIAPPSENGRGEIGNSRLPVSRDPSCGAIRRADDTRRGLRPLRAPTRGDPIGSREPSHR